MNYGIELLQEYLAQPRGEPERRWLVANARRIQNVPMMRILLKRARAELLAETKRR